MSQSRTDVAPDGGFPDFRATILDDADPADSEVLERLRAAPEIEFVDLRDSQREWLAELIPRPSADVLDEPTKWAYLPWRRVVVGVLGPRGFRRARFDRNRNKITTEEQNRLGTLKIGIVGLSVGHSVAHTLALEGLCGELRLADFDKIELPNLNRIPGTVLDFGVNKAVVVARRITELDPYVDLQIFDKGFNEDMTQQFFAGLDIVIEESDTLDAKIRVRAEARSRRIPVVMEASDRGTLDVERFDLEPDRPLFHGLLGDIGPEYANGLTDREVFEFHKRLVQLEHLSPRMAASLPEIGRTLSTWPQLGGDVQLGGASIAAVVRRIGLGEPQRSGRVRIDLAHLLDQVAEPGTPTPSSSTSA